MQIKILIIEKKKNTFQINIIPIISKSSLQIKTAKYFNCPLTIKPQRTIQKLNHSNTQPFNQILSDYIAK